MLKFADPSLQQRERVTEATKLQAESAKEISIWLFAVPPSFSAIPFRCGRANGLEAGTLHFGASFSKQDREQQLYKRARGREGIGPDNALLQWLCKDL
jgi:hypothetical protein